MHVRWFERLLAGLLAGLNFEWWVADAAEIRAQRVGMYLYYAAGGTEPEAMRIRPADHRVETITSLAEIRRGHGLAGRENADQCCP